MKFWSKSFQDGQRIPETYAFGKRDSNGKIALSDNVSPHFGWSDLPTETQSLALVCIDVDVPSKPDDVNKEGRQIPKDLPRVEFCHLVLVDIDPNISEIKEGQLSRGVTPRGKAKELSQLQARQGINDYTSWFQGDENMEGQYFGYDGPCPPWNDTILHHYHFRLYALNCRTLDLPDVFTYADARPLIEKHKIREQSFVGTYSINPDV